MGQCVPNHHQSRTACVLVRAKPHRRARAGRRHCIREVTMTLDMAKLFDEHLPEKFELASRYVNPTFVKVLKLIGLDKSYRRAEGCYLYDTAGNRYLDC